MRYIGESVTYEMLQNVTYLWVTVAVIQHVNLIATDRNQIPKKKEKVKSYKTC